MQGTEKVGREDGGFQAVMPVVIRASKTQRAVSTDSRYNIWIIFTQGCSPEIPRRIFHLIFYSLLCCTSRCVFGSQPKEQRPANTYNLLHQIVCSLHINAMWNCALLLHNINHLNFRFRWKTHHLERHLTLFDRALAIFKFVFSLPSLSRRVPQLRYNAGCEPRRGS